MIALNSSMLRLSSLWKGFVDVGVGAEEARERKEMQPNDNSDHGRNELRAVYGIEEHNG
jgi:hypothetical protein